MTLSSYPMKLYHPTLYISQHAPTSSFRAYRRVKAMGASGFEYHNPMSLAKARPMDMDCSEISPTQLKYEAVNRRIRQRSTSRPRSTTSSDRWSVTSSDLDPRPDSADLRLARRRMTTIIPPMVDDYPPVRAQSNQYERLTHNLIRYGALRKATS